jgi:hypothetical protein
MRTQKDFLQEIFSALNALRKGMGTPELVLLDSMEERASMGPALTSNEIRFLEGWKDGIIKRGKDYDDFIARTSKVKAD